MRIQQKWNNLTEIEGDNFFNNKKKLMIGKQNRLIVLCKWFPIAEQSKNWAFQKKKKINGNFRILREGQREPKKQKKLYTILQLIHAQRLNFRLPSFDRKARKIWIMKISVTSDFLVIQKKKKRLV